MNNIHNKLKKAWNEFKVNSGFVFGGFTEDLGTVEFKFYVHFNGIEILETCNLFNRTKHFLNQPLNNREQYLQVN